MPINLQMPALSPTMEEGTLAKWLVKEGDEVASGDLLAEIETDKATMEFEAVDEGTIAKIVVAEGTDNVKVGEVIAIIAEDGEDAGEAYSADAAPAPTPAPAKEGRRQVDEGANALGEDNRKAEPAPEPAPAPAPAAKAPQSSSNRVKASPLARRLAEQKGVDLSAITGTGPNGRIIKADIDAAEGGTAPVKTAAPAATAAPAPAPAPAGEFDIPHSDEKLSGMRKTIARRLSQSMQEAPHIYLTVDCQLDALLDLRKQLNESLEARGVKLSVNDMLIKALAIALEQVPDCNVSFLGDTMRRYTRQDISVAVSIPGGLITPVITDATNKPLSKIATEMKDLAARAQEGKLQMHEYQGGTASISNMGMMGIKQFTAVINPPQSMILAVGAGEKRPHVVDGALTTATMMTVTGSFDHRAIDGADGAKLLAAFKTLVEKPMGMLA
ncbi:pyruvate dehydrogenase E2 component (dihydrolipoamide acetyltransferase) [Parasphingorhabdus marina DSM 22363]|uniref:Acetyltransferase component of pyruvate dehydrogenase complex n=1 Tax=Parasphingorhabdus marina DSM 22363 TaxID=1123272 RepID=A0A1N6FNY2_9SPHN|nr:pyruvate dehydrogenase complex dihydrolipoamide acetyltransferase [Parasphingorhabdus marina]SIN97017.1 pyruvate dehydrogenase E2 component (dihydrolipoamide acetyltransferase) [Parasphingorhabdus marina DSM 22363]